MASWESWFRTQSAAEARNSASKLELQIRNESVQIHRDIGERYADAIALADRLASLKMLSEGLHSHVVQFSSPGDPPNLRARARPSASSLQATHKLERILLSLADRSIVQHKYAATARALYFYEELFSARKSLRCEHERISHKLTQTLESWMVSGSFISQNMFDASLIHLKLSPSEFLQTMLQLQLAHLSKLLEPPASIAEAFKAVDATLFIYSQAVVDWHHSRLSQRRIVDMPEFRGIPGLHELLEIANVDYPQLRAYPAQCYGAAELSAITSFLDEASAAISLAASRALPGIHDAAELVATLAAIVSQAQNSLSSADSGIAVLLEACEPHFSKRLLELVEGAAEFDVHVWERSTTSLKQQIASLSKIARNADHVSPAFVSRLQALEAQASELLNERIGATYKAQRSALLAQHSATATFDETACLIVKLSHMDLAYAKLGATPDACNTEIYEHFGHALVREYKARAQKPKEGVARREYWSSASIGTVFELELLIDGVLPDHHWDVAGLGAVRRAIQSELAPSTPPVNTDETGTDSTETGTEPTETGTDPTETEAAEHGKPADSDEPALDTGPGAKSGAGPGAESASLFSGSSRSALLLQPLVM